MSAIPSFAHLTVGEAQRVCTAFLKEFDIDGPVLEARLLLGFVLGGGPERVLADRDEHLTDHQVAILQDVLEQRRQRIPVSQILGIREFWSLPFKVTSATLTPRPDTETLVEAVLDHVDRPSSRILDLGTGTGCILLALLSEWPDARGVGVDASEEALAVAGKNAEDLGLAKRTRYVKADWRTEWMEDGWMDALGAPFDVVVSNPPYIPAADIEGLEPDVRVHEPRLALDGGDDGLDAYRIIISKLDVLLGEGGLAGFEVGIGQSGDVAALMRQHGLDVLEKRNDLGGVARAVIARKRCSTVDTHDS